MSISPNIDSAIRSFNDIFLLGVPIMLRENQTSFLSFLCTLSAIDALSGYRHDTNQVNVRYKSFISEYFPAGYMPHIENLYKLRCRMLHNFSPAYFTLIHSSSHRHLTQSEIGDTILSDDMFFNDMKNAAEKFFKEVIADPAKQNVMESRLLNTNAGGTIFYN